MSAGTLSPIPAGSGLLVHLIRSVRPDLAEIIAGTNEIETAVIGLGGQGTRHAGLMQKFGTKVTAGIAPGRAGERIKETIPVFDSVADCVAAHPNLAAVSIWRHFSSAREAALEAIAARVPLVVLISEGIPLRDVRDIIAAAREGSSLLLGGNTPGAIFPPERIKVGMLPDVFHPAEPEPNQAGPRGVTILSRSGAILYHMSDALASAGIAQNGVIGVGGDGAIGSTFRDLVPLVMRHDETDLVVVAGEIGGSQEELFAADIKARPELYPKPLLALISGKHAPAGKTMGHAGAIVAPGQEYGTFRSKRDALTDAGVTVVNSQYDLITAAKEILGTKTYFDCGKYYERMKANWETLPEPPSWGTQITLVEPNNLVIAGIPLKEIIPERSLVQAAHLLVGLSLPDDATTAHLEALAITAAQEPAPAAPVRAGEQLSATLARFFLMDEEWTPATDEPEEARILTAVHSLGRAARFVAEALGNGHRLDDDGEDYSFGELIARAVGDREGTTPERVRLIEAMAVASVDHGVTPPSAQATVLAATVRAPLPMALASGVGAITDVHGGAGMEAAKYFLACRDLAKERGIKAEQAASILLEQASKRGGRTAGLGHRVHTKDPRRDILWALAESAGISGDCVAISKLMERIFPEVRGFSLPINVDGVIGAVVADLGLDPVAAKALFILGRVAGLTAHYFEEILTQPPMRRVNFAQARYRGLFRDPV